MSNMTASQKALNVSALEALLARGCVDFTLAERHQYFINKELPVAEAVELLAGISDDSMTFHEVLRELDVEYKDDPLLVLTLDALYRRWVNIAAVRERADNSLLASDDSSRSRLNKALAELLAVKGQIVTMADSYYGWQDLDVTHTGRAARVAGVFNVREDKWKHFNGTFANNNDSRSGVTADVILTNGTSRYLRAEGSLSEFMTAMNQKDKE